MSEKKPNVTYDMFLRAVDQIVADGGVPTVRLVVAITGGSNTTIQAHYQQWLQGLLAACRVGNENLSRGLLDHIVAEMDAYAAKVAGSVNERLKAALERLCECEEENDRVESSAEALRQELDAAQKTAATRIKALEAELEQAAGRAAALKESVKELQEERDRALRQEREAGEAAARCRQEAENAVAEAKRTAARLAELDREVDGFRERLSQAEKQAAVTEERARQLDATVAEQRLRIDALADAERRAITAETRLKALPPEVKKGNGSGGRSAQPELGL